MGFSDERPMRVGIIGGGQIARVHGPLILQQPRAAIVGIADWDITRARALANWLGAGQPYVDAQVMIEEQRPDVVHVLTPPHSHTELSILAMRYGCHVLVEKPMALTVADAQRMLETAQQSSVRLCVNHNMVVQDVVRRAKGVLARGVIGELVSVEAHYVYNPKRDRAILEEGAEHSYWAYRLPGGPLQDHMPHPASLVLEFLPEVEEVQRLEVRQGILPRGWPDEIRVLIRSGPLLGSIGLSLNESPDAITLTLRGTDGLLKADLFNGILILERRRDLPRAVARGLSGFQLGYQYLRGALGNVYRFATSQMDRSNGVGLVISQFYASIRDGGETPIPPDRSLRVVELISRIWPTPAMEVPRRPRSFPAASPEDRQSPMALVTGASGFIGFHLVSRLLAEGVRVRALVRPNSIRAGRLQTLDLDLVEGDLADLEAVCEAMRGVKVVYHLGGALSNDWEEHRNSTIRGTEHVLQAALAHQVERVVYVSSLAVYDLADVRGDALIREDHPYHRDPKRMGAYAWAKIEAETRALEAHRRWGLGVTVVRPGIVIGPMGRVFPPHLGYHYGDRLFLLVGGGGHLLPLVYIENAADGICRASRMEKAIGQAYNLVDDEKVTAREYLQRFAEVTGVPMRIIRVPYAVPYLASAAVEAASFLGLLRDQATSRAQLRGKHLSVRFDSSKAREELGWQPVVPLWEGLTQTFRWYAERARR